MRIRVREAAVRASAAEPDRFADHLLSMLEPEPIRRPGNVEQWATQLQ
jgi:hypothetical protein